MCEFHGWISSCLIEITSEFFVVGQVKYFGDSSNQLWQHTTYRFFCVWKFTFEKHTQDSDDSVWN